MKSIAFLVWAPLTFAIGCGVSEIPRPSSQVVPPSASGTGGSSNVPSGQGGSLSGTNNGGNAGNGGAAGTGGTRPSGAGGTSGASGSGGAGGRDAGTPLPDMGGARDVTPPPPPSGMTVSINGMAFPKEKVIVFLHIGHSNMAGRVTTPEDLRPFNFETHPQLWSYAKGGVWKAAKEPLSPDSMTGSCGGVGCAGLPFGAGPGMSILRAALATAPDAQLVSIGRGQSGLTAGVCRSFRKGALLYDYVMGPAMELKGKVTFGGIFTMFGQSEVNDASNYAKFGECLAGVASDMRADLGEPNLPFLVGDWEEGVRSSNLAATGTAGRMLIPQIRALPMQVMNSAVIPTDGLPMNPLDGQHYDLTGYKGWGERGIALLKTKGWSPWASQ